MGEYEWQVAIDVDNDRETGPLGFDYALGASHSVYGSRVDLPLEEVGQANSWADGGRRRRLSQQRQHRGVA